jgi:ABC-type sugar transport system ATPase subunit
MSAERPSPAAGERHRALQLVGVHKTYGATVAVTALDLDLAAGQVHAIVGENGAGKSTVAQIAAGVVQPTRGEVRYFDQPVVVPSAREAESQGIVLIPQELQLYESLSVTDNLYVGRPRPRGLAGVVRSRQMRRQAAQVLSRLGVKTDPAQRVEHLSHGTRQLVAIARALILDARVLIMDEPTAALDEWEAQRLLGVVTSLRASGVAILYVSHRLQEVIRIADLITVMRDGEMVTSGPASEFTEASLVGHMVGRPIELLARTVTRVGDRVALETRGLTHPGFYHDVSLAVRSGEVLGLAGLIGSGRSEFAQTLFGYLKPAGGEIDVGGVSLRPGSVPRAVRAGLGYVPEERQSQGLFMTLSARENVSLPALDRLRTRGLISRKEEASFVWRAIAPLRLRGDVDAPVSSLSGGNQQKVLLARWLALAPRVMILDEPTRGIDVATRAEIYGIVDELTADGVAVLLISSDIQELLLLSDRVVVMRAGRLVAEFAGSGLTELNIGSAVLGAAPGSVPGA